jgi:hypothetical protein
MSVKEMKKHISDSMDILPEEQIIVISDLVSVLIDRYWEPVIETDITDEEHEEARQSRIDYKNDPDSFITLEEYRARRAARLTD